MGGDKGGARPDGTGCEASPSAADGVFAESHPSRKSACLYCSFCGKADYEVRKLIAGPTVFICDECVKICADLCWPLREPLIAKFSLLELEARLLDFLRRHGRSRKLSLGMLGELFYALDLEFDFTLVPRDTDGSPKGSDPQGLDGEAATAGAEGIAQFPPETTHG